MEKGGTGDADHPEDTDIRDLVANLATMTEDRHVETASVALMVFVDPDLPLLIYTDQAYVTRCLMNLMSNALVRDITNRGSGSSCCVEQKFTARGE